MRTLPACVVGAAVALVACGGDDPATPDAAQQPRDAAPDGAVPYALACAATPLPTTGPGDVYVTGTTVAYGNRNTPVANVALKFFKFSGGTADAIREVTSGPNGDFDSESLPAVGQPYVGFVQTSLAGSRHTLHHTALPLVANAANVAIPVLTAAEFAALDTGGVQDDSSNGALLVSVEDCAGTPVTNAVLTVTQADVSVGTISKVPGRPDTFLVLNVPAGRTLIGGRVAGPSGNVELYAHEVGVRAANGETPGGALTITSLRPGP